MRGLRFLILAAGMCGCSDHALPPPIAKPGVRIRADVEMRDGVALWTKFRLPRGRGPFPALLVRTPYPLGPLIAARCAAFNRQGYACGWQFVRGRGRSEGAYSPFVNEPADGRDTIAWMAAQPWCDGNVAMLGESYIGATAWAMAIDPPPELKTIVPTVFATDLAAVSTEGGMFRHDIATAWMSLMPGRDFHYLDGSRRYHRALERRPRIEMDLAAVGREVPWFREWVGADVEAFRARPDVAVLRETPARTPLPVLTMAGWSDAFLGPQVEGFAALATREESVLVIGPWDHLDHVAVSVRQQGLEDGIGLSASYSQWPRLLDWLGHHLKGEPLSHPVGGVAAYAVNGGGWHWYEAWPPPTEPRPFVFAAGGDPQRCTGVLRPAREPGSEGGGSVSWRYDPRDPTPSRGGAGVLAGSFPLWRGAEPGFLDQGRLCERRDDLLGFVTEPLAEPLHVAGKLRARLVVSSDMPDTAFNVRFLEERADGSRIHVREGILALSAREAEDGAVYVPRTFVTIELETWPVEYVFEAGSRLLVEVASASFPKFEAHANTAEPWADAVWTPAATQTLALEESRVILPVRLPLDATSPAP